MRMGAMAFHPSLLLLLLLPFSLAATPPLSDFLSFTNRGQLTSSPGCLCWVETTKGVANIACSWCQGSDSWTEGALVTAYTADDGMDIGIAGFFRPTQADAASELVIHFSRAPSDDANPTHVTPAPVYGFYALALSAPASSASSSSAAAIAAEPQLVTRHVVRNTAFGRLLYIAGDTAASPASGNLAGGAYLRPEVWMLHLAPDGLALDGTRPAQLLFATKHGVINDLTWDPRGSLLAFSNDRGDHGFVGIVPVSNTTTVATNPSVVTWVSPSVDTDVSPRWSPSGNSIAWMRLRDTTDSRTGRDTRCKKYKCKLRMPHCHLSTPRIPVHCNLYRARCGCHAATAQTIALHRLHI